MHQIFYIDIDEEITSVIDRLRKSKTTENFFVVSPRSLIIQRVVSLKLLKREAEKENKQIAIVVNDKEASTKVEKAGILVLSSLKGLEGGEEIKENFSSKMEIKDDNKIKYKNIMETNNKKSRLQEIGSESFYDHENDEVKKVETTPPISPTPVTSVSTESPYPAAGNRPSMQPQAPTYVNRFQKPPSGAGRLGPKNVSDVKPEIQNEKKGFSYTPQNNFESFPSKPESFREPGPNKIGDMKNLDPYKEKIVEGFFNPGLSKPNLNSIKDNKQVEQKIENKIKGSSGMKKVVFVFIIVCLLIVSGISAYLFLPKATITVETRDEIKKVNLDVKGSINENEVKIKELTIPGKIIEKEDNVTESFKSTGSKQSSSGASQKAKGKIIIYNEYSKETQQLVATTRFLSSDKKLFRLVKGVVVPGMTDTGKAGSVEAEVIADQTGDEYNIDPSEFKIPGFEDGPKYDKFYAKSISKMSGGGSGGSGGVTIISQSDLDNAKKEAESKIKDQLEEKVKNEIGSENVLLPEASEKSILESSSSSRLNELASSFDYKVKGKIKAVVFSESDIKKLVGNIYNEANKEKTISDYSLIKISYGISSADLNSGTVDVKVNAEIPVNLNTDWNDLKKKLLGKNDEEIKEVLKEYPQVDKINIDFWPKFVSQKIPQYEKRVDIVVENSSN